MAIRIECVLSDSAQPAVVGRFWAEVLGWRYDEDDDGDVTLTPPEGTPAHGASPELQFLRVPDPKTVKNRLHIDLRPDDQEAEVARVESLGATRIDIGQSPDATWVVLADPEGNEFCILRSR